MKQEMRLRYKAALSLALSAALFALPVAAFSLNTGNAVPVKAEAMTPGESAGTENGGVTGNETENGAGETESGTEDGSGPSGETEPECVCEKKCTSSDFDRGCAVCAANYGDCAYKTPNVVISINKPAGWYRDGSVSVRFKAYDAAHTGNFKLVSMMAKIGQNGSWTDVTEDKALEISENCTVYVQVTDQKGNTYERNRAVRCFDTVRPTLNAAVSDGLLSVEVHDTDSGAKAVYVNGYEFKKLTNGVLNIRLQKFDAGYEYFTIYAMDRAGNLSEVYKTKNPYYKDPSDEGDDDPAGQLPTSAEPTKPGNAAAEVTDHTQTDGSGNAVSQTSPEKTDGDPEESKSTEKGKEFYTIQTATDKVFYLVIDRDGEEEKVYFLTEITENDLLNVTSDNSETLPKNSAALESAIPVEDSALPNNNGEQTEAVLPGEDVQDTEKPEETDGTEETEGTEAGEPEEDADHAGSPLSGYILMGVLAAAVIGGAYYFKVLRKKKEDFVEDEDDAEESEDYGGEEDTDGAEDDFFDGNPED